MIRSRLRFHKIEFIKRTDKSFMRDVCETVSTMAEAPIVNVTQGQLRGNVERDYDGKPFYSFHGIPYAKPPLNELRFKDPEPAEPWEGIRDATEEGSECYSMHMIKMVPIGTEDCLFLNVFTPQIPKLNSTDPPKPVMVYIHGGAFTAGSNKREIYGPEFLIREDIVLITINYRLGVLGFLSMEDTKLGVNGNAALKDMVMALNWVKNNVNQFGGDPNNVTIFGESAGAGAVHYLMLSPLAKGLFHKAIAQSGCALNVWATGSRVGKKLAELFGCNGSEEEALKVLQSVTKEQLLDAQYKLSDAFFASEVRPHGPVIEKGENQFISSNALDIIKSGNYNKVPLMMGFNSREGLLFEVMTKRIGKTFRVEDFKTAIPHTFKYDPSKTEEIAEKIKQFYFGDQDPNTAPLDWHILLSSDQFFIRDMITSAKLHAKTMNQPVYIYRMSIESDLNVYKKIWDITHKGVGHADDLGYLFKTQICPKLKPNSIEELGMRRFTRLWANFARTGKPTGDKPDELIPVVLEKISDNRVPFLDIGENLTIGVNPENERIAFWEQLFETYKID